MPGPSDADNASNRAQELSRLLKSVAEGDTRPADRLGELVYQELRALADMYLGRHGGAADHTLQPTALVHEAWLKLVEQDADWNGRAHFMATGARAMRHILIDHARGKQRDKRGGNWQRVELDADVSLSGAPQELELLDVDDALTRLHALSPRQAQIVELRFFGGLEMDLVAEVLGVSKRTVQREWRFSKAWLTKELG